MENSGHIVKLYGAWGSPFVHRVIWALKLKGVEYEYIEEDLSNKSSSLLEYNPVHKEVPVLIHNGKPVVDSIVILEYIEETWPHLYPLLPADSYDRALARFWIDFGQQKRPTVHAFCGSSKENNEKTGEKMLETLNIIQDQALGDKKFFGGDSIGMVDLYFGWYVQWFPCFEQLAGLQVLNPSNLPKLHKWAMNFKEEPIIKETLYDSKKLLLHLEGIRKKRYMAAQARVL
ncbi:hypothetical protein ACJIZ3_014768 [Penstemon smallii]|uniref:Glutathione S-transferase n=1 Tax=Penstemon smallii TaxID=265156 RepID=A0ABD3RKI2_9LAMI